MSCDAQLSLFKTANEETSFGDVLYMKMMKVEYEFDDLMPPTLNMYYKLKSLNLM